jgi:hypothetical protein
MPLAPKHSNPSCAPDQLELGLFGHARAYVDIGEAARALDVSAQQIREYIERGLIHVLPVGDDPNAQREHLRIRRASVEAMAIERELARNGAIPPYRETPEITWWRTEIRRRLAQTHSTLRPVSSANTLRIAL